MKRNPALWLSISWLLLAVLLLLPGWRTEVLEIALPAEWVVAGLLLWAFSFSVRKRAVIGLGILFAFLLFFAVYEGFIWQLYRVAPNLFHEWSLIVEVFPIFWSELSLGKLSAYLPLLLLGLTGLVAAYLLLRLMLRSASILSLSRPIWLIGLLVIVLATVLPLPLKWTTGKVFQAWEEGVVLRELTEQRSDHDSIRSQWPDSLASRPNIYLIFLESYGKLLETDPAFRDQYATLLDEMERDLADWQMLSHWSAAPISGGRSWLAFTSVLTGQKLYAHPQYTALLEKEPDYPHLVRFLKQQGYYTLRMNTLKAQTKAADIPYEIYDRFFAFDRWLKYDDFPYQGPEYGKFGSVPDQYALGYGRQTIRRDQWPFFLFFISLNSHSPWNDTPLLTDHWEELNQLPDTGAQGRQSSLMQGLAGEKYWQSMAYQLRVMQQCIEQQGDSNSLFIFLGDHQPPFLSKGKDGFETPVHIFSKQAALMTVFAEADFQQGLRLSAEKEGLRHEDLYALLLSALKQ